MVRTQGKGVSLHGRCVWGWVCTAQRNYRFFLMFVGSAALLCVWVFSLCLVQLLLYKSDHNTNFMHAMGHYPAAMVLLVYTFCFFLCVQSPKSLGLELWYCLSPGVVGFLRSAPG
jgi:DHHC palmitoyltransferase